MHNYYRNTIPPSLGLNYLHKVPLSEPSEKKIKFFNFF